MRYRSWLIAVLEFPVKTLVHWVFLESPWNSMKIISAWICPGKRFDQNILKVLNMNLHDTYLICVHLLTNQLEVIFFLFWTITWNFLELILWGLKTGNSEKSWENQIKIKFNSKMLRLTCIVVVYMITRNHLNHIYFSIFYNFSCWYCYLIWPIIRQLSIEEKFWWIVYDSFNEFSNRSNINRISFLRLWKRFLYFGGMSLFFQ